jgi:hypothetical protein
LPLLEHATMEHESELHELWENLLAAGLDPSAEETNRMYVSVLAEMTGRDAHELRRMYAEWSYFQKKDTSAWLTDKGHRYSSGVGSDSEESRLLFYRLGLVLPVHVAVDEYRRQRDVTQNTFSIHDPPFYVEGGEKIEVLGDLSVVAFTKFGQKFCETVLGDVSAFYVPPKMEMRR